MEFWLAIKELSLMIIHKNHPNQMTKRGTPTKNQVFSLTKKHRGYWINIFKMIRSKEKKTVAIRRSLKVLSIKLEIG